MLWWINKHKHSISIVHIFRVMSFKAFCKFLRRRNLAWGFWGVNFWSRDFWGVLLEALRIWLGFDFCPHSIIPVTWNPEYPQPWGEGELIHSGWKPSKRPRYEVLYPFKSQWWPKSISMRNQENRLWELLKWELRGKMLWSCSKFS